MTLFFFFGGGGVNLLIVKLDCGHSRTCTVAVVIVFLAEAVDLSRDKSIVIFIQYVANAVLKLEFIQRELMDAFTILVLPP